MSTCLAASVARSNDRLTPEASSAAVPQSDGGSSHGPCREIAGDLDASPGLLEIDGDLAIGGAIRSQVKVAASGTIRVGNVIEDAEVQAARDLLVKSGIIGKLKASCRAGGAIHAKYMNSAQLEAGGDVVAETGIANCTIMASGCVRVEQGAIVGGNLIANAGATCDTLGSDSAVPTIVEAGFDARICQAAIQRLTRAEADLKAVAKVRQTVDPLLRNQKALTPEQKEKATELVFRASELEDSVQQAIVAVEEAMSAAEKTGQSQIVVTTLIYPGVRVRFRGIEAAITSPMDGPLQILLREVDGRRNIVVMRTGSEDAFALPTRPVADQLPDQVRRLLGKCRSAASSF